MTINKEFLERDTNLRLFVTVFMKENVSPHLSLNTIDSFTQSCLRTECSHVIVVVAELFH